MTPDKALERLQTLCARSEQCSSDLRKKLSKWGVTGRDADNIISDLEKSRYLDDARFAVSYVRDKYRFAGWGRHKIISGLLVKRIPRQYIDDALAEIDLKEYAGIAFNALAGKLRTLDRTDMKVCREKLLRFGVSRGYETSLVLRIIQSKRLWL